MSESKPHNLPLGGGTGPERLGGDAARGEPKTLVGASPAENQHQDLYANEYGVDPDAMAALRSLEEQLEALNRAIVNSGCREKVDEALTARYYQTPNPAKTPPKPDSPEFWGGVFGSNQDSEPKEA